MLILCLFLVFHTVWPSLSQDQVQVFVHLIISANYKLTASLRRRTPPHEHQHTLQRKHFLLPSHFPNKWTMMPRACGPAAVGVERHRALGSSSCEPGTTHSPPVLIHPHTYCSVTTGLTHEGMQLPDQKAVFNTTRRPAAEYGEDSANASK